MEKKKCILYGFAVLSALTGAAFTEQMAIFGEELKEEPIPVIEEGALKEQEIVSDNEFIETGLNENELQNTNTSLENVTNNQIDSGDAIVEIEENIMESDKDDSVLDQSLVENTVKVEDNLIDPSENEKNEQVAFTEVDQPVDNQENVIITDEKSLAEKDEEKIEETSQNNISLYAMVGDQYGYGYIENNKLVFYLNGEKYTEKDIVNNSWMELDINGTSIKYYVKDNQLVSGMQIINGKAYYFEGNYELLRNGWSVDWDSETDTSYGVYADENGYLQKGWIITEYDKYYFGNDYKGLSGVQTIDGKQYYLDYGRVYYKYSTLNNGIFYYFGEDGSAIK